MTRRTMPMPELLATLSLMLCTVVVATVVSIQIAKADAFGPAGTHSPFALAGFIAVLLALMGGITAAITRRARPHK